MKTMIDFCSIIVACSFQDVSCSQAELLPCMFLGHIHGGGEMGEGLTEAECSEGTLS